MASKPKMEIVKMAGKRRSRIDVNTLSPEEREKYEARLELQRAPKDAYLIYSVGEDGDLEIHSATRDANEVLKQTSGQVEKKYQHFLIK